MTMSLWECPVCHGTYRDPAVDGGPYFHVCPPLSGAELEALPPAQVQQLIPELPPKWTRAELERVLMHRPIARPGARDENVTPGSTLVILPHPDPVQVVPPRPHQDQPPRIYRGP